MDFSLSPNYQARETTGNWIMATYRSISLLQRFFISYEYGKSAQEEFLNLSNIISASAQKNLTRKCLDEK
jgi:hypothetical protein